EWRAYFDQLRAGTADVAHGPVVERFARAPRSNGAAAAMPSMAAGEDFAQKQAGVLRLMTAYRARGHLVANLDPLGMMPKQPAPDLELEFHGLAPTDLDREFTTGSLSAPARMKLRDIVAMLKATYTGSIG